MITSISFRNGHKAPPKSLGHLHLREQGRQPLQKFAQKAPQPPALPPPSTARTAGRSGGCGGACDASRLSCFLFRPRKRLEKRRKRSHTNVSNALVTRTSRLSQTLLQTPLPCFHASINEYYTAKNGLGTIAPRLLSQVKVGTHSPFGERSHTAAHTAKQGRFRWGRYHYPRSVPHVHKHPRAGCQNGVLCRFGILAGRCSRRTQKAFGTAMRLCVSLSRRRRGPAGLRRPTPPAERTVLAPISPRVQLCLRRPAFPLSAFIPGA